MSETRKIAAILVADIVGYSRLAGADEDRTLSRLRGLRSDLIDPAIDAHHGRVVKRTGDGGLIEFRSVVDAVRCAIEVQNGLIERNAGLPPERLPDAIRRRTRAPDEQEISRFPREELEPMPGSLTTPGRNRPRGFATVRIAFRPWNAVGARDDKSFALNGWPMPPPADASPPTSRSTAHGSGPVRCAKPSP